MPPMKEITIPIITQKASRTSRNSARMLSTMTTAQPPFSSSRLSRSS